MKVFGGGGNDPRSIRNGLFGTWLGHPFHPLIVTFRLAPGPSPRCSISLGVARTTPATDARPMSRRSRVGRSGLGHLHGANDWRYTSGKTSRIGLIHGCQTSLESTAMGLSMLLRMSGSRASARVLSTFGLGATAVAAYLGGELVYAEQIGVSHVSSEGLPHDFSRRHVSIRVA